LTIFSIAILSPNFLEADTSIQEYDFGNVAVGSTLTIFVKISTTDTIKLSGIKFTDQDNICSDITLSSDVFISEEILDLYEYNRDYILFFPGFFINESQILTIEITYTPSGPRECLRVLEIHGPCDPWDWPCSPVDEVFFIGMGVEKESDNLSEILLKKLQEIINYTNEGYAYQTFKSYEQDTLSKRRMKTFQEMLYVTYHLIENGHFEAARNKLNSIYKRTNGKPKPDPNDFVPSDKSERLASMLQDLISSFDSQKKAAIKN
jgi:hypothetical protein